MTNDIKFTPGGVIVEGALGVNETAPQRPIHVTGDEIHSGGTGAGFSFSSREAGFQDMPAKGERWVWYASAGTARLWSGNDKISIDANGHVDAFITSNIRPFSIIGTNFLGRPASVRLLAQDVLLTYQKMNPETGKWEVVHPEDTNPVKNFALSHMEGDTLVVNRGAGYVGGVTIEGAVKIPTTLSVAGHDVGAELAALRNELDALKKKVG